MPVQSFSLTPTLRHANQSRCRLIVWMRVANVAIQLPLVNALAAAYGAYGVKPIAQMGLKCSFVLHTVTTDVASDTRMIGLFVSGKFVSVREDHPACSASLRHVGSLVLGGFVGMSSQFARTFGRFARKLLLGVQDGSELGKETENQWVLYAIQLGNTC